MIPWARHLDIFFFALRAARHQSEMGAVRKLTNTIPKEELE
jgi:hypothetical protein